MALHFCTWLIQYLMVQGFLRNLRLSWHVVSDFFVPILMCQPMTLASSPDQGFRLLVQCSSGFLQWCTLPQALSGMYAAAHLSLPHVTDAHSCHCRWWRCAAGTTRRSPWSLTTAPPCPSGRPPTLPSHLLRRYIDNLPRRIAPGLPTPWVLQ